MPTELFLHNILQIEEACFMHKGTFDVHSSHLWLWDNPHANLWIWVSSLFHHQHLGWSHKGHCHGPLSATLQAESSMALWFSGNCSTEAASRCASSCETEFVVSAWWSPTAMRGKCPVMAECDISRKLNWMSRADYMASSVTRSNSDRIFLMATPEGACLCSPSQDHWRSHGKTSSSCDNGRCQQVKVCSRECPTVHCHLPLHGQRPIWMPIVTMLHPCFDH
jgi:hypothetical protein